MFQKNSISELRQELDELKTAIESDQTTSSAIAQLQASIKSLEDKIDLSSRFHKIEEEHQSWKTLGKYVSITAAILAVFFGIVGVTSFNALVRRQLDQRLSFYVDFAQGVAYSDKYPDSAVPALLRCFQQKPDDEPVLIALLDATDKMDDWNTQEHIVRKAKENPFAYRFFRDALTYNNLGIAELNLGFRNDSYFRDAKDDFERGLKLSKDPASLWYLHSNLWRYYLVKDDVTNASHEVKVAASSDAEPPPDADSWDKTSQWAWFQEFFKTEHKIKTEEIAAMWNRMIAKRPRKERQ